jgi:hypothetical protein
MTSRAIILTTAAFVALGAGPAISGPCTTEIDAVAKTLAAKDAGSGPTAAGTKEAPASLQTQHPPTAIMKQQTEGKAASPDDVRRQTAGQSTAAQQGTTGAAAKDTPPAQASSALDRARGLDRQGKEAECMEAVREARQLSGQR